MARLSTRQIYDAARAAGFSPHEAVTWAAIARAESGGRTTALNDHHEYSVGLWQINLNAHENVYGDLHDPVNNARAAYAISQHGRDMRPWTTTHPRNRGTAADYRTYLPEVEREIGLAGDPRGTNGYRTTLHPPLTEAEYEHYFPTRPGAADAADTGSAAHPTAAAASGTEPAPGAATPGSDADADGLLDYFEKLIGTDPTKADTDGDHLTDGYEVAVSHTDPTKADTDGDGVDDGAEIAQHTDAGQVPTAPTGGPAPTTLPGGKDRDHDGLSTAAERLLGTSSRRADTDDDGLTDGQEISLGTDPLNPDSDFDGITDGAEVEHHRNPLGRYTDADGKTVTPAPWTVAALTARATQPATAGTGVATAPTTGSPDSAAAPSGGSALGTFLTGARAQKGDTYDYASTPKPSDPNPTRFDCSSLVQWAAHHAGVALPRTAEYQYMKLRDEHHTISVDEALRTPGALLFYFSEEPHGALPPGHAHVAVSLGNGMTIEARGSDFGVGEWTASGRSHHFNRAAIVPGLSDPTSQADFLAASGVSDAAAAVALTAKGAAAAPSAGAVDPSAPLLSRDPDAQSDRDHDGLTKAFEILAGTDPDVANTDIDGLDHPGRTTGVAGVQGAGSLAERVSTARDRDGDGVSDQAERILHLDPDNPDSDGDQLTDGQELALGTDPHSLDSNANGLSDWLEVHYHLNPLGTDPDPGLDHALADPGHDPA